MKLSSRRLPHGHEVQLAPFIDVTFLLIIFFMLSSRMSRFEREDVALPAAQVSDDSRPDESLGTVVVNLTRDGRLVAAGQPLDGPSDLRNVLSRAAGSISSTPSVLLRADRGLSWERTAEVLRVCRDRNVRSIKVAVQDPTEE
jgi:biopolymer transport protein ExbD